MKGMSKEMIRTAGGGGRSEDLLDRRVHHDAHLSFVLDSAVSGVGSCPHELLEVSADDRLNDVGDVGPWELEDLLPLNGQGPHGLLVLVPLGELDELLDRQAVEVRHLDHLDLVAADASTVVAAQVPQVPGRDGMDRREVAAYVTAKKSVDLYKKDDG